uniref:DH domain-containing protein n=1 Tax=Heterorhabditis bacteriophora TaxID=37862 RepID=A0A1I7XFL0_HETBA
MMNVDYYNSLLKNTPKKKPIPPPRKSLTGACSHVKLRCYPPERKTIFTFDFEASIANHAHNKSVKDPGMEQDTGIKVEDPGGNEDIHGTLRTCGKDLILRVPSPDYDLIRVQMEDITPNKSTSFQRGIQEVGKNSLEDSMIRMGPEWSVPKEYSSSPIVRELAESAEERPRPPSSSQYGSSITSVISSRSPNYIIQADKQVTLLEQIIRSHPICEELQIGLRLPSAVTACKTTKELQSIALLGQDFWTSEMSIPRSVSRISHITSESTTSFMESQAEGDIDIYPGGHYAVNDAPRNRTLTKKRVCSGRNDPLRVSLIRGELKASANVTNGDSDTNSPPSKHDRQDTNSSAVSGSSSTGRRSFLKNLFFGNDGQQKQSASHQLAQCQYFIPFDKDKVKSSRSAFNIGDLRREDCSSTKATTNHQNTTSIMRTFKPVSGYDEGCGNKLQLFKQLKCLTSQDNGTGRYGVKKEICDVNIGCQCPILLPNLQVSSLKRLRHLRKNLEGKEMVNFR